MNSIAIVLGFLTLIAVAGIISRPWWGKQDEAQFEAEERLKSNQDIERQKLVEQRETILTALRDLDFDYSMDKLPHEDYLTFRQNLLLQAADIMTQLDLEQTNGEVEHTPFIEANIDPNVDPNGDMPFCPTCGQLSHPDAFYCTYCGAQLETSCPACQQSVQPSDQFCVHCGVETPV